MDVAQILERLNNHVETYFVRKDTNSARKAGEAVCKIIILNTNSPQDLNVKFDQLINSLVPSKTSLPKLYLNRIQHELKILQALGNADSHDGEEVLNPEDFTKINNSLMNLLYYLFSNNGEFFVDCKIPSYIYSLMQGRAFNDDDWRCQQIISTIYPNRKYLKSLQDKDFELYIVEDADNRRLGFLGLKRNVAFNQAFSKALIHENIKELNSLTFLFPVEISKATGETVKGRKEYIQKQSAVLLKSYQNISCSYHFYEDYIWEKCLPENIKSSDSLTLSPDFIDQNLHNEKESFLSLSFVDKLVTNGTHKKPLNIIFGQGGVGKTTFCEQAVQKINDKLKDGHKKKAIFISSNDIPDESISASVGVSSIEDLYMMVFDNDEDGLIEKSNLALNISCGNLILIIDGLDEIISKLKDKFIAGDFFESIKLLNDTYRNCTVIITSREINLGTYDNDNMEVLFLKGFDDNLINTYLAKKFRAEKNLISQAYDNIKQICENGEITPLIIRLVSDLTKDNGKLAAKNIECSYLYNNDPLDKVLLQVIAREIKKQSLDMSADQYFGLLQSIVFEHSGKISEQDFKYQVEYILSSGESQKFYNYTQELFNSYLVSPLLQYNNGYLSIRYESISFLIKARFLTYVINSNDESIKKDKTINSSLAQDCFKGGALVKEISLKKRIDTDFEKIKVEEIISSDDGSFINKKIMSAVLYIYLSNRIGNRKENAENIISLFGTAEIRNIAIFGSFYPLDFTLITVIDGYFDAYNNLAKSLFPEGDIVFKNCKFKNIDHKDFGKSVLSPHNFNSDCELSEGLDRVMEVFAQSQEKRKGLIEDDLVKIFKVGYKKGAFIWKSLDVYKQQCATLKTRYSLISILHALESAGYLMREAEKSSVNYGYRANPDYAVSIKDFVTQSIIDVELDEMISRLDRV